MNMKVHCDHCRAVLRVPESAAGHWAKCPSCQGKFKIPQPQELWEETVSTWIEQDVEDLHQEAEEKMKTRTAGQEHSLPDLRDKQRRERQAVAAQELRQALRKEAQEHEQPSATAVASVAAAAPPTVTHAPASSPQPTLATIHVSSPLPAVVPHTPAAGLSIFPPIHPSTGEGGMQVAPGYPSHLFPTGRRPYLLVATCDQAKVSLAFDSSFLEDEGFRLSMPVRCPYTGQTHRSELLARPLAFCDRSQAIARSPRQIEEGHEARLIESQDPREMLRLMGVISFLPRPFDHVMPYYVAVGRSSQSLACHTQKRPDGGITCYLAIPDGAYALEWLTRVNGVCGPEHQLLTRDVSLLWSTAWRSLPDDIRHRLTTWCAFEPGECFLLYLNDADFAKKDEGLAGLVFTDRRLIFHKYHRSGSLRYVDNGKLLVRSAQGMAEVLVVQPEGLVKVANLHMQEVPALAKAIQDNGLALDLSQSA